jgi:hypothetical protein
VSKLRLLSRRFRRENRLLWAAFQDDVGDYAAVAVTQTCRHLSEYEMARYLLPRLDRLKEFCSRYWDCKALKSQILGGRKGVLRCLLDNFEYFAFNVQAMCVCHHQHLFRIFESADGLPAVHLRNMARMMEDDLAPAMEDGSDTFLENVYKVIMKRLYMSSTGDEHLTVAETHELWAIALEKGDDKMLCNPAEVRRARAEARARVAANPPTTPVLPRSGERRRRMLARLRLHFDVAISKLEEHSNSLEEMTLLSYVSGAKRNTYAAENCMGMFREQTLCAGMKRMELINCVVVVRLDRRRDPDGLFAGWDVPGISRPAAVMQHDWQNGVLVRRMRNIREKGGWLTKKKKLKAVGSEYARLEAKEAAARDEKEREALKDILKVDVSACVVGGRSMMQAEFPTYELFRTGPQTYDYELLSAANGFRRPVCDVLCKVLQALPAHLNPLLNANVQAELQVMKTVPAEAKEGEEQREPKRFFDGMPAGAPTNRCPSFRRDTVGNREGTHPDVKLTHPEVMERLRLLCRCCERAGFPVAARRSLTAPRRPGDDDAAAAPFVAPTPSVLLRIPAAIALVVAVSAGDDTTVPSDSARNDQDGSSNDVALDDSSGDDCGSAGDCSDGDCSDDGWNSSDSDEDAVVFDPGLD